MPKKYRHMPSDSNNRRSKGSQPTLGFISHTLRIQLWDAIHHGRTLYGKPCTSIRSFFRAVDKANRGSVRRTALGAALTRLDVGLSEAQVARLLKTMDADNSGGVDFAEFASWMRGDVVLQEIDEIVDVLNYGQAKPEPEPEADAEELLPTSAVRERNALTVATAVVKCMEDERFVEGLFSEEKERAPPVEVVKMDVFIALQKDRAGLRDELRAVRKQLEDATAETEAAYMHAASAEAASLAATERAESAEKQGARKVVELHAALEGLDEQATGVGAQQLVALHAAELEKQDLARRLEDLSQEFEAYKAAARQLVRDAEGQAASLHIELDESKHLLQQAISKRQDSHDEQQRAVAQLQVHIKEYEENASQAGDSQAHKMQVRLRQFLLRCVMKDAACAWSQWVASTASHKRMRLLARKTVGRLMSMKLHASFERWSDMARESRSQRVRLGRAVSRMHQASVCVALSRWQEHTSDVVRARASLTKVMTRMMNLRVSGAWSTWVSCVEEVTRMRGIQIKAAHRILHQSMSSAFRTWVMQTGEMHRARSVMTRLMKGGLARALLGWRAATLVIVRSRSLVAKVVGRMASKRIAAAFGRWEEMTSTIQIQRHRVDCSLRRISHAVVFAALSRWQEYTSDVVRARANTTKVMARIVHARVASAFDRWSDMAHESRSQKDRLKKAVGRMQQAAVYSALSRWQDYTAEVVRTRVGMTKMLRRMLNVCVSGAWSTWVSYVEEARRMRGIQMKVARRILHQSMVSALCTWLEQTDQMRRCRDVMTRLVNGSLSRALIQWQSATIEFRQSRSLAAKVVGRLVAMKLHAAFDRWSDMAHESRSQRDRLSRAVSRMRQAAVYSALSRWQDYTAEAVQMRASLTKVMARIMNLRVTSALASWVSFVEEAGRMRGIQMKVARRILNHNMSCAFASWSTWTLQMHRARGLMNRLVNGGLSRALAEWRLTTIDMRRTRTVCGKVIGRLTMMKLYAAFDRWSDMASESRGQKDQLTTAVTRMRKVAAHAALTRWKEHTSEVVQARSCLMKAVARMKNVRLGASWRTWRDFMKLVYEIRADNHRLKLMTAMAARMLGKSLVAVFRGWQAFQKRCLRSKFLLLRMAKSVSYRRLGVSFRMWQFQARVAVDAAHSAAARAALLEHAQEKTVGRIVRQLMHSLTSAAFAGWLERVTWRSRALSQVKHCLEQWRRRGMINAMVAWAAYARSSARARDLVEHRRVNTQLREQLERCAGAMNSLLHSAGATGRTVPEMAAAVADAERVAARAGPGLARQFDDCTFIRTEFKPVTPQPASDLPVTPVKSPGMSPPMQYKASTAEGLPTRVELEQQMDLLAKRDVRLAAAMHRSPYRHTHDQTIVGGDAQARTPSPARTVIGAAANGYDYGDQSVPWNDASQVFAETSTLDAPEKGGSPPWSSSPPLPPTPAEAVTAEKQRKNEALHARLLKSGYYSAAAKVKPLYHSPDKKNERLGGMTGTLAARLL